MIPGIDLVYQYEQQRAELDNAIARVVSSGCYLLGEEVEAFESEFAEYCGVSHCVGVANGTDALHLALAAAGVGQGDVVITVSHTAVATIAAIRLCGAIPRFVDIDPERFTMDPAALEAAIDDKVKAIIAVHLYGQPADLEAIMTVADGHGVSVIEDCAQAHGAAIGNERVGSFGAAAAFSFYPTKNLGAMGDGGAVVSRDGELIERIRLLRQYGWQEKFVSEIEGWNSRLDEIQAAILRVRLRNLDQYNGQRISTAELYNAQFDKLPLELPKPQANTSHVYHQYVVKCEQRDALLRHLWDRKIGAGIHYPIPVHLQKPYSRFADTDLGHTETVCNRILSLPIFPGIGDSAMVVSRELKQFFN